MLCIGMKKKTSRSKISKEANHILTIMHSLTFVFDALESVLNLLRVPRSKPNIRLFLKFRRKKKG